VLYIGLSKYIILKSQCDIGDLVAGILDDYTAVETWIIGPLQEITSMKSLRKNTPNSSLEQGSYNLLASLALQKGATLFQLYACQRDFLVRLLRGSTVKNCRSPAPLVGSICSDFGNQVLDQTLSISVQTA
jgi:hypothetical protein